MLPQVMILDEFPLQKHTGKVDRQKLLEIYNNERASPKQTDFTHSNNPSSPRSIIAHHLGVNESTLDAKKTFTEHGGSSLSAVATVVALHRAGHTISLDSFLGAWSIKEILEQLDKKASHVTKSPDAPTDMQSTKSSDGASNADNMNQYHVEMLHKCTTADQEAALEMLASGFASRNPLDVLNQSGVESLRRGFGSMWPAVIKDEVRRSYCIL